jgi:hypothetical protein
MAKNAHQTENSVIIHALGFVHPATSSGGLIYNNNAINPAILFS